MVKSRPVVVIYSVLAGLQVLSTAGGLTDHLPANIAWWFVMGVAVVQTGMSFYVQQLVVPAKDVTAYIDSSGNHVAGPAAGITNGVKVQELSIHESAA